MWITDLVFVQKCCRPLGNFLALPDSTMHDLDWNPEWMASHQYLKRIRSRNIVFESLIMFFPGEHFEDTRYCQITSYNTRLCFFVYALNYTQDQSIGPITIWVPFTDLSISQNSLQSIESEMPGAQTNMRGCSTQHDRSPKPPAVSSYQRTILNY
jgi:hypothetical protein